MIQPLGNMVLLSKIVKEDRTTSTGLVLSAAFSDYGPNEGIVIAIGTGEQNYKGDIIPVPELKVGDIVYFPEHGGIEMEDEDNKKYILVTSKNILAIKR
jgi:co-chaperonin GroES (HSP10)